MSVVLLAYHQMGAAALRLLLERHDPITAVFTYADRPGENCWFDSVAAIARDAGLPVYLTEEINNERWVTRLRELAPDLILSIHYRHMLGRRILEIPRREAVNLHPSLLPRYRGRCPLNWQLVNGEAEGGVTLHYMTRRADAGDIIGQQSVRIGPETTAIELYHDLVAAGETLLARYLDALLAGTAPRIPQDESRATVYGGRRPEDGRIDWGHPARRIHDLVRAVAPPWPGAFSDGPAGRWMIDRTRVPATAPSGSGGQADGPRRGVLWTDGRRLLAGTGDGLLEILEHRPPPGVSLETGLVIG